MIESMVGLGIITILNDLSLTHPIALESNTTNLLDWVMMVPGKKSVVSFG